MYAYAMVNYTCTCTRMYMYMHPYNQPWSSAHICLHSMLMIHTSVVKSIHVHVHVTWTTCTRACVQVTSNDLGRAIGWQST